MAIEGLLSSQLSAYQKVQGLVKDAASSGGEAGGVTPGGSFSEVLANYAEDSMATIKKGEQATIMAAKGKADITEVVTAVSNAELTLQTMVTVRDKVISAYQDIIRMPN